MKRKCFILYFRTSLLYKEEGMVIIFGVPKEYSEDIKDSLLVGYSDLIAKLGTSEGIDMRVSKDLTEEVPTKYFHILLKKDLKNPRAVAQQFATGLVKLLEVCASTYFHPSTSILILDRDEF